MIEIKRDNAIEEVFSQYKDKVYRLAVSLTKNTDDAQDVLQNTFLKIIKNLKNFKSQARLSTWIYRIAYNEALMYLRKRNRQFRLSDSLEQGALSGLFINWSKVAHEQLAGSEFRERLDRAIRYMPIKYRMPLLLHRVEDLSLKDASCILGLKVNTFKTRLHRAQMIINNEISDYRKDKLKKGPRELPRCGIWTDFAYDFIAGPLQQERGRAFRRHIEDCAGCKSFLETYSKAICITKSLQCQDLSPELRAKIESFLLKNR